MSDDFDGEDDEREFFEDISEDAGLHEGFTAEDIVEHESAFLSEHGWELDEAIEKAYEIADLLWERYGDELLDIDWYDDDFWEVFRELYDS